MFRSLRWKFVWITVCLTGLVLVVVLGSTLWTSRKTQRALVDAALERGASGEFGRMPKVGGQGGDGTARDARDANMLALSVDVSMDGVIVRTDGSPLMVDANALEAVVSQALGSDDDEGYIEGLHVAWRRVPCPVDAAASPSEVGASGEGLGVRVVIVDTSAMDEGFRRQLKDDALITLVALCALFAIAWVLSGRAIAPAQSAYEEQRRFIADASHELKTPLAVIVANTDILLADAGIPEGSRRWVASTSEEATQMRSLVNDLLELARTEDANATGTPLTDDVDLSDVVNAAALEFDAIAFERGCRIEPGVEPGIRLRGNHAWLSRLARILVDNACKYAEPGSTITVSLSRSGPRATLTVNNRGNVIDPQDLPHLFDRFYRSDRARGRDTGGFGLGLAIAQGIAERHGGRVRATSTERDGTTFTVTL